MFARIRLHANGIRRSAVAADGDGGIGGVGTAAEINQVPRAGNARGFGERPKGCVNTGTNGAIAAVGRDIVGGRFRAGLKQGDIAANDKNIRAGEIGG